MKKLFSLFMLALLTMSAWAANTYSYTFSSKQFSQDGTVTLNNIDWTLVTDAVDGYYGYDATKGQQLGSSSKPCKEVLLSTSGIEGTITKVTVNASTGKDAVATMEVTVGEATFISSTDLTSTATSYEGTGSASGEVLISLSQPSTSKALYIKSIEIEYEGAVVSTSAPVFTPNGGTFTDNSIQVSIACPDGPADIYYSEGTELDWTNYTYYSGPFYINETKTFTAVASRSNIMSDPTTVTFTKLEPSPAGTFIPGNFNPVENTEFSITSGDITLTCTNGTITAERFGFFKYSDITFTSAGNDIVKIEFTCTANGTAKYGPGSIKLKDGQTGTYTAGTDKIGTWTGKAESVAFTASENQLRATQIVVTLDDGTTVYVAAPTFSREAGDFEEAFDLTITAEEGAAIKYSYDNENWNDYTTALNITETTTVYAKAILNGTESAVASATYTKVEPAEAITTLAQVNALGKNAEFTFEGNAVVTVQRGAYLWLRDASGYGLIYGNINGLNNVTFAPGTVLNQGWTAKTKLFSGLMEYTDAQNVSASENTDAELAAIQTITELDTTMVNAYVQVLNVKSLVANGQDVTATLANGTTMVMYNSFGESLPTEEGNYTVKGVVSTHNGMQLMILSVEGFVPQTIDVYSIPEAIEVGENDTFTMYDDIVVTFNHASTKRMWIRDTDGNSGLIYGLENTDDIVNGTVLSDGWTGKNYTHYGVPQFQNTEGVVASGETAEAKPFEVPAITASDVNAYVIFKGINMLSDASNEKRFYNAADSTVLFNTFNMTLPEIVEGNTYDVTGVVTLYNGVPQLYITEVVESINDVIKGDANNDTVVNVSDAIALLNALLTSDLSGINTANADVDDNGTISITDVIKLVNYLSNGQWQ